MASPNRAETQTRFVRWFRWSAVQLLLPASFALIALAVGLTGIFASSIHSDPAIPRSTQWAYILVASAAHFVAILGLDQWHTERKHYRERARRSSP